MPRKRRLWDLSKTLLLLGIIAFVSAWFAKQSEVTLAGKYKIVDGDSLFLQGREIRLLGIDAPEYRQECTLQNQKTYPCGKQSRGYLAQMVKSGNLECKGWEEDKYQRLLAICSVGETVLNSQMVLDGWAVAYGDYESEENKAKARKVGVWQGGFESPSLWRERERDAHSVSWLSKFSLW